MTLAVGQTGFVLSAVDWYGMNFVIISCLSHWNLKKLSTKKIITFPMINQTRNFTFKGLRACYGYLAWRSQWPSTKWRPFSAEICQIYFHSGIPKFKSIIIFLGVRECNSCPRLWDDYKHLLPDLVTSSGGRESRERERDVWLENTLMSKYILGMGFEDVDLRVEDGTTVGLRKQMHRVALHAVCIAQGSSWALCYLLELCHRVAILSICYQCNKIEVIVVLMNFELNWRSIGRIIYTNKWP